MLLYQLYLTTKVFGICIRSSHLTQQLIQLFPSRIIIDIEPAAVFRDVLKQLCIITELHDLSCQFSGIGNLVIRIWCRRRSRQLLNHFACMRVRLTGMQTICENCLARISAVEGSVKAHMLEQIFDLLGVKM